MTRDEAYTIVCKAWDSDNVNGDAELGPRRLLDAFVALGMLKLDEPKSVEDRAVDVLKHYAPAPRHVIHDLAVAGLKIVEK